MKRSLVVAVLFLGGITQILQAEQLKIKFTGTVSEINDSTNLFSGLSMGDPVSGFFYYDLNAVDSNPDSSIGRYEMFDSLNLLSVTAGSQTFSPIPTNQFVTTVKDNDGGVNDTMLSLNKFLLDETTPCGGTTGLYFGDSTQTVFSSDALPQQVPDLADYDVVFGYVSYWSCDNPPTLISSLIFDIDSVALLQDNIPTVSTWGLVSMSMLITIGATILLRRRIAVA